MKLRDLINKIFRRNVVKMIEEPKSKTEKTEWKESLQCLSNDETVNKVLEEQRIRRDQIKATASIILLREGHVSKEDIESDIHQKYDNIVLDDIDIQSLIAIHDVVEYEDFHAENNIREFIEEEEDNFVYLVDKLKQFATEEAKRHGSNDVSKFVPTDVELVDRLKNELEEKREKIEQEEI